MAIEINQGESLVESTKDGSKVVDNKLKRIDFADKRVYQRSEGVYYPSVTSILSAAPIDPFFLDWVKMAGKNADWARDKAAAEGTAVHEALEALTKGEILDWKDNFGNAKYSLKVWQMILEGADFLNTYKPKIIAAEQFLFSDKYQYAGTTDLLCKLGGKIWLLDWKTSNTVSDNYKMQLAAYAKALEERQGIKVDSTGVLWLKASTRGNSKKEGVYQGAGWQLIEYSDVDTNFEAFLKIYDVFKLYNPTIEPYTKSFPTEVKLEY